MPPPGGRGYSYGNWEPVPAPGGGYAPSDRAMLAPGPGMQPEYAARPPMEITPPPGGAGSYPPPPSAGYQPPGAYPPPTAAYSPPPSGYPPAGVAPPPGGIAGLPPED